MRSVPLAIGLVAECHPGHTDAMRAVLSMVLSVLFAVAGALAGAPRNAGSIYFDEADRILANNWNADVTGLAERGWAVVRAAGPSHPGFLDGVYTAARIFRVLGYQLRVESIYAEAIKASEGPALAEVRVRLNFMFAYDLIGERENVKAESILRSALSTEARSGRESVLHVAFLQSLAFDCEQEGDLSEAEYLYKSTLGYTAPDLTAVPMNRVVSFPGPPVPPIGEPRAILAGFFVTHARAAEAEQLYREAVRQANGNSTERLDALRQLSGFLAFYGSKEEAVATERQVISLLQAQRAANHNDSGAISYEREVLAERLTEAGHADEARAILEDDLVRAKDNGTESAEYQGALRWLFQNRMQAKDYDAAEQLAREAVDLAEANAAGPDSAQRNSAISELADVRHAEGKVKEAEELLKSSVNAQDPGGIQDKLAKIDRLIREGKPQEAFTEVERLAEAAGMSNIDVSFNFRCLARSFLTWGFKSEAAKVAALGSQRAENRARSDDPRSAYSLVDWAGFYRGQLGSVSRADELVTRAEMIVRACCGLTSPQMEPVLRERAWMAISVGPTAHFKALEELRDFRAAVYGSNSWPVEESTRELAASYAESGQWKPAAKLYLDVVDISARRTGGQGYQHVQLLNSIASEFHAHGDCEMALTLDQHALKLATGFARAEELQQLIQKQRGEIQSKLAN
jgi:tetratricopeptide (TPR) repeat protein